jgi:hypothetical protein
MVKKMKKENKEKAVKTANKSVVVDSSILNGFRELVSTSTASIWGFISTTWDKMSEGESSVRIARASIKEGEKSGKHPVVKSSQVEGFGTALKVNKLQGATEQPIATILKVSMRAQRVAGVEGVDSLIEGIKTYAGFIDRLESAEDSKAEAKAEAVEKSTEEKTEADLKGITPDAFAELTIKYFSTLSMADAKLVNEKLAMNCLAGWNQILKNSKVQVKANA